MLRTIKKPAECSSEGRAGEQDNTDHVSEMIYRVNYNLTGKVKWDLLTIFVENNFLINGKSEFLIDTGSQLNLIKENFLNDNAEINSEIIYSLTGIGKGMTKTLGETILKIENIGIKFQVV